MAENRDISDFTVYLEGHDGHRGNVLVHSFIAKVQRIVLVLNRLERAYINSRSRHTDFEIVAAEKRNPTMLTLKAVPHIRAYDPKPALHWSIQQIAAVSRGETPDLRVTAEIAKDFVELATKDSEHGYRAFWINGHTEAVRFDDNFLSNATAILRARTYIDASQKWHIGTAKGSVVGELKAIDDLDGNRQFFIVPPTGGRPINCTFPDTMRSQIGTHMFQIVKVSGTLHYGESSPFPFHVDAADGGIERFPTTERRRTLKEMRGAFSDFERKNLEISWSLDAQ